MNIVMVTNTYAPHVGGVAHSIVAFREEFRRAGHRVLIVAPEFPHQDAQEIGVIRIPALQNFNGSDFSVVLPIPGLLLDVLDEFQPDIIHSHHPYLLGMTALRNARYRKLPLVFTHHTLYERYTHYIPGDSPAFARFIIELATRYANLTDQVFAPSESVAELIRARGVTTPITVVPTGIALERFGVGNGPSCRHRFGIPRDAFVIGHVGRLEAEKNLGLLAEAVVRFMADDAAVHFLVVGKGEYAAHIREVFARAGMEDRLHLAGPLVDADLVDAYHAMEVFAFSSTSETQGMVLIEAMAAGTPVVALDACGAREVVRDGQEGRLLREENPHAFADALRWLRALDSQRRVRVQCAARERARRYAMPAMAQRALAVYEHLIARDASGEEAVPGAFGSIFDRIGDLLGAEWDIV
ncbi:MAG: glycosyltransferase, partial [Chromatiales bacterium]|nr:glycosyltransferase [Chromatiales bacterium]